jgi:hypothetical protein
LLTLERIFEEKSLTAIVINKKIGKWFLEERSEDVNRMVNWSLGLGYTRNRHYTACPIGKHPTQNNLCAKRGCLFYVKNL